MKFSSPKSRGNWNFKFKENHYETIFGHSGPKVDTTGTLPKDMCQGDDYDYSRRLDKVLGEYKRFPNPNDKKKIEIEFFGRQQEYRNGVIKKELNAKYGR